MRISDWSSDVCSSDLRRHASAGWHPCLSQSRCSVGNKSIQSGLLRPIRLSFQRRFHALIAFSRAIARSEAHTSELQSLMRISYPAFCLKKNNNYYTDVCVKTTKHKNKI